jgi:hypothetical protein
LEELEEQDDWKRRSSRKIRRRKTRIIRRIEEQD